LPINSIIQPFSKQIIQSNHWHIIPRLGKPISPTWQLHKQSIAILFTAEGLDVTGTLIVEDFPKTSDKMLLRMLNRAYSAQAGWSSWFKWQGIQSARFIAVSCLLLRTCL
jgi:hypothetical protein